MEAPDAVNLGRQLNRVLDDGKTGYCVVYTHLGVLRDDAGRPLQNTAPYLNTESRAALERLSVAQNEGDVLVTTTRKLLTYALLMAARPWTLILRQDGYFADLQSVFMYAGVRFEFDWTDFAGLHFIVNSHRPVHAVLNGETRVLESRAIGGRRYAGLPWSRIDMSAALLEAERHAKH